MLRSRPIRQALRLKTLCSANHSIAAFSSQVRQHGPSHRTFSSLRFFSSPLSETFLTANRQSGSLMHPLIKGCTNGVQQRHYGSSPIHPRRLMRIAKVIVPVPPLAESLSEGTVKQLLKRISPLLAHLILQRPAILSNRTKKSPRSKLTRYSSNPYSVPDPDIR
jgi:hypothetical protein